MASERTLSIIKPDATRRNLTGAINAKIEGAGLRIIAQKRVKWKKKDAEAFYKVHRERPFFKDLVRSMTSGPIVIQVLEGDDAVAKYREVMGATNPANAAPGTIRKEFAQSIEANSVHGSDSPENAGFAATPSGVRRQRWRRSWAEAMWVAAYIIAIVGLNWLFDAVAPIMTPFGALPLATFIVGAVFVLRDYAQRQIGHYILLGTLFAGVLTWFMVKPSLAVASTTAFAISEMADWAIFSFTGRPLQQRILISSLFSVPLDTLFFLYLADFLTPASFAIQILSKAVGVMVVWYLLKLRTDGTPATAH